MITLSVDTTQIEKERLYRHENGKVYLDLVLIATPNSKYDDYLVKQNCKKGEDLKLMPIIGNAKDRSKLSKEEESEILF